MLTPVWFSRLAIVCACLALAFVPATGRAQQAPAAQASDYEVALSAALDAYAKGEYESARMFLERAHGLEPSARTFRGLGIVAFAQKRYLEAIRALEAALASEVKPLPDDLRTASEDLLRHAFGQVGRIEIELDPEGGDFMIDGKAPDLYAPNMVVLEPGEHLLTARAPARAPYEKKFMVKAGDHRTLQVVLAVPPPPEVLERVVERTVEAPGPTREKPPILPRYTPRMRRAGFASGAVLVAGGVGLWMVGKIRLDNIEDRCRRREYGDGQTQGCTREQAEGAFDRANIATYGALGITAASLGLGTLVTFGVLEGVRHRRGRADLQVTASVKMLSVRGRF